MAAARTATPQERTLLTGAAFEVAWPVVYHRLTRRVEWRRGHRACSASAQRLADDCLDRFYDDVESVIDDLLSHATKPIRDLEGWIASRLNAATVDGHRRRRGKRGALQRPRVPGWLATALDHDQWLLTLATELLVWVGLSATAGTSTWPLESWVRRRAAVTGDHAGSTHAVVVSEVDRVLAAMRQRPPWYEAYVETPLGCKQAPVAVASTDHHHDRDALPLTERYEGEDARLRELAAAVVEAIAVRTGRGEDPRTVVVSVVRTAFGTDSATRDLDQPPHAAPDYEERVGTLLADPEAADRLVERVLAVVTDRG